jgi:hypothetical protein
MSSVLYGRGTYRQGDTARYRVAVTQRDIGDLADDQADLQKEVRALASAVDEIKKALAAVMTRLDAFESTSTVHSAPTSH